MGGGGWRRSLCLHPVLPAEPSGKSLQQRGKSGSRRSPRHTLAGRQGLVLWSFMLSVQFSTLGRGCPRHQTPTPVVSTALPGCLPIHHLREHLETAPLPRQDSLGAGNAPCASQAVGRDWCDIALVKCLYQMGCCNNTIG